MQQTDTSTCLYLNFVIKFKALVLFIETFFYYVITIINANGFTSLCAVLFAVPLAINFTVTVRIILFALNLYSYYFSSTKKAFSFSFFRQICSFSLTLCLLLLRCAHIFYSCERDYPLNSL